MALRHFAKILGWFLGEADMIVYTVPELAALLGMKPRAARRLLADKEIAGRKVGRKYLCTEESVRRYLEGDQQQSEPRQREVRLPGTVGW